MKRRKSKNAVQDAWDAANQKAAEKPALKVAGTLTALERDIFRDMQSLEVGVTALVASLGERKRSVWDMIAGRHGLDRKKHNYTVEGNDIIEVW